MYYYRVTMAGKNKQATIPVASYYPFETNDEARGFLLGRVKNFLIDYGTVSSSVRIGFFRFVFEKLRERIQKTKSRKDQEVEL